MVIRQLLACSHLLHMTKSICTMMNLGQSQAVWQKTERSWADHRQAIFQNLGFMHSLLMVMFSCLSQWVLMRVSPKLT